MLGNGCGSAYETDNLISRTTEVGFQNHSQKTQASCSLLKSVAQQLPKRTAGKMIYRLHNTQLYPADYDPDCHLPPRFKELRCVDGRWFY